MLTIGTVAFGAVCPVQAGQKLLVVLADFGEKPVPREIIDTMKRYPALRLTVPYAAAQKGSDDLKLLCAEKRVESAVTLGDEPLLPLLVNIVVAAPLEISFAWPQDAWDIVVRGREELQQCLSQSGRGLYLRSGFFSSALIPDLKRLGIRWARVKDEGGTHEGCYIADAFVMVAPVTARFASTDEYRQWIAGRPEDIVVLEFGADNPLNAAQLRAIAGAVADGGARMTTIDQVYAEARDRMQPAGDWNPEPDRSRWMKVPMVWYHLGHARQAIEDYMNSGSAKLPLLEQLRGQIFKLYDYRLLSRLQDTSDANTEIQFLEDINRIFALLNLPASEAMPMVTVSTTSVQSREFAVTVAGDELAYVNSGAPEVFGIERFTVLAGSETVSYSVVFTSAPVAGTAVDIYMDLNNQEGAGLTRMLSGIEAFMDVPGAWEFALRIEEDQAVLYRSGRFEPTMVRKFSARHFSAVIPRGVLRGNVLNWGYQALALDRNADGAYTVFDFLCVDEPSRARLKAQSPLQLPAIRAGARARAGE